MHCLHVATRLVERRRRHGVVAVAQHDRAALSGRLRAEELGRQADGVPPRRRAAAGRAVKCSARRSKLRATSDFGASITAGIPRLTVRGTMMSLGMNPSALSCKAFSTSAISRRTFEFARLRTKCTLLAGTLR